MIKEETLHINIATFLAVCLQDDVEWTTVEGSTQRGDRIGRIQQSKLKTKGVKKGWPDIQLFWNDGHLKGLLLEIKTIKGTVAPFQKQCHEKLCKINLPTEIVRSIPDVKQALQKHKVPHRNVITF